MTWLLSLHGPRDLYESWSRLAPGHYGQEQSWKDKILNHGDLTSDGESQASTTASRGVSPPVGVLTGLGALIAILGLFGGNVILLVIGLVAVAVAGLIQIYERRR